MEVLSATWLLAAGDDKAAPATDGLMMFAPLIAIGIVFYFLLLRPQRKEQASRESMLAALKKNDKVLTIGGVIGSVANISSDGQEVTLRVDDNTRIKFIRSSIQPRALVRKGWGKAVGDEIAQPGGNECRFLKHRLEQRRISLQDRRIRMNTDETRIRTSVRCKSVFNPCSIRGLLPQEYSMSSLVDFLNILSWLIVFFVFPIVLGIGICRALKVKEFGSRTAFVLLTIFISMFPFASKIVQDEAHAYRTDASEWISAANVKDVVDRSTKQNIKVDSETDKPVRVIPLAGKDISAMGTRVPRRTRKSKSYARRHSTSAAGRMP